MLELRPGTDSIIFWIGLFFPWYEMWPYFLNTFLSNSQHYVTPSMNFKISQLLRSVNYRASQEAVVVKNLCANAGDIGDMSSIPGVERSPGGRHGNPLQFLAWRLPWRASLEGYRPQGHKESDTTEATQHTHMPGSQYLVQVTKLKLSHLIFYSFTGKGY